jgi:hypothetical protein
MKFLFFNRNFPHVKTRNIYEVIDLSKQVRYQNLNVIGGRRIEIACEVLVKMRVDSSLNVSQQLLRDDLQNFQ